MKSIIFKTPTLGNFKFNLSEIIERKEHLNETFSREAVAEIEKIIDRKVNKSALESQIKDIVNKELKGSSNEKVITDIVSNCMVQLYKQFWMNRASWKSKIVNKPS